MNDTLRLLSAFGLSLALAHGGCSSNSTSEQPKTIARTKEPEKRDETSQAKVISKIETLGGKFIIDENRADKPIVLVDLGRTSVTDADLGAIEKLTDLEFLGLADSQVTDAGLIHLERLAGLKYLKLWATKVTDAGLFHLKGLSSLQDLHLGATNITDAGLENLTGLKQLSKLNLQRTAVTDEGAKKLQQSLPNCKIMR